MKKSYAKQKLMSAAAMLAVSVMMLSSASFAWFSVATTDTVTGVVTTVKANQSIEIATTNTNNKAPAATAPGDTGKNETWGATITFDGTAVGNLGPAKPDGKVLKTVQYGADGRPTALVEANSTTTAGVYKDGDGNDVGIYKDIWIRTNVAGNIQLKVGTNIPADNGLKNKVKVGVQVLGTATTDGGTVSNTAATDISAVTADGSTKNAIITSATANTAYLVRISAYLDGDSVTNADMANGVTSVTFDTFEFTNSAITTTDKSYTNTDGVPAA